jgi:rSAM/selenodomain-associated transferase 1
VQRRAVLVFLKLPVAGRVKTRLAATLGDVRAVEVYRRLVERVFTNLAVADIDEVRVMYDPPDEEEKIRHWLAPIIENVATAVEFFPQSSGDLGDRLAAGFSQAFEEGSDAVAAIGTDCVAISAETFSQCWAVLHDEFDALFGPTEDGGYYLVAMKKFHADLFRSIPWSADDTLARSLQQAEACGLRVATLDTFADVDTEEDWNRARDDFFPSFPEYE